MRSGRDGQGRACDALRIRQDIVDQCVWDYLKQLLLKPEMLLEGLKAKQEESERVNQRLLERLDLIETRLKETNRQLEALLDQFLMQEFSREVLQRKKQALAKQKADLERERDETKERLAKSVITEAQFAEVQSFCKRVAVGLENCTFEDKRHILELLNVQGIVGDGEITLSGLVPMGAVRMERNGSGLYRRPEPGNPCPPNAVTPAAWRLGRSPPPLGRHRRGPRPG